MRKSLAPTGVTWKESIKVGLSLYLPLRLGLSALVAALVWLTPELMLPPRVELMARWGIPAPVGRPADLFLTPWLRFDALWYLKIALNGYELSEPNIHHLPLYPGLTYLLHRLIGGHIALSALIVSNVAFILALGYVYRLVLLDDSAPVAWRTTFYLAIFPTAVFYLVGYTESLFLLGSAAAFYYARQRAWFRVGLLGAVSALARPQGVLILLPLLVEFWQRENGWGRRHWFRAIYLALIPVGVGGYAAYLHVRFTLPAALAADTAYWQMQPDFGFPGEALWLNLLAVWGGIHRFNNSIDLVFALFGVAMTIWAIRQLRISYWLFVLLNVMVFLSRPIAEYPLLSTPRFILPLFPIYILLGRAGEASPVLNRLVVYAWLGLFIFFGLQFAMGGWVA